MIHAKPQLNGNTVEHFTESFYALSAAEKAIEAALSSLRQNVFHGRNYQHIADPMGPVAEDNLRVKQLHETVALIAALKLDIVGAIQPERPARRRTRVEGCEYCERNGDGMMPPHDASLNCRSGGHSHCTCDTCF